MATIKEQKLIDGTKRSLLKYVVLGNGTQNSNTVLVDVSSLAFSLNANGKIMSSNTHPKSTYRTTIKRCFGTLVSNGSIRIQWHGDSNTEALVFGSGSFDFDFQSMGDGAVISNPEANSSGDILISTVGLAAGEAATIFLDLKKDNRDYDAGQTADPYAFNAVT